MALDLKNIGFVHFVSQALDDCPAETPAERSVIYQSLRKRIHQEGVTGMSVDEALGHLESTIARQDCFRGYFDHLSSVEDFDELPGRELTAAQNATADSSWFSAVRNLFRRRGVNRVLSPEPGPAEGPYSDDCFAMISVRRAEKRMNCRIWYRYDPACVLQAEVDGDETSVPFEFEIRAWGFRHAVEHLADALLVSELTSQCAAFQEGACWQGEARDVEGVMLPGKSSAVHAFSELV